MFMCSSETWSIGVSRLIVRCGNLVKTGASSSKEELPKVKGLYWVLQKFIEDAGFCRVSTPDQHVLRYSCSAPVAAGEDFLYTGILNTTRTPTRS